MPRLTVNVDHIATLRQARGGRFPDPVHAAVLAELAGAHGITVHLREDRRHIQDHDVRRLRSVLAVPLNLEIAATEPMVRLACEVRPDLVTLVPEKRQELTTEGGLDVVAARAPLASVVGRLREAGIPVSLFVDPELAQLEAARGTDATAVELHTGRYANAHGQAREAMLAGVRTAAERARTLGLEVHAGHGLDYRNVVPIARLPGVEELAIGHAIIARAAIVGMERAVTEMLALVQA